MQLRYYNINWKIKEIVAVFIVVSLVVLARVITGQSTNTNYQASVLGQITPPQEIIVSITNESQDEVSYSFNLSDMDDYFHIISSQKEIVYEGSNSFSCMDQKIWAEIDLDYIKSYIDTLSIDNNVLPIYSSELFNCHKMYGQYQSVIYNLNEKKLEDLTSLIEVKNNTFYLPENFTVKSILDKYAIRETTLSFEGDYEEEENYIALFKPYQIGHLVDSSQVYTEINRWLLSPNNELVITKQVSTPNILKKGKPIYDFTQSIGKGETRMSVHSDGTGFAVIGVYEMNKTVVMPGKEFSFVEAVNPNKSSRTIGNYPVGDGICSATTAVFRAALEGGFKITDRTNHGKNYASYSWGYPLNIVDATYYSNPEIDFKFKNDTKHPIYIRAFAWEKGDGYQYHRVEILGSKEVPKRDVKLTNWETKNKSSASDMSFTGSFTRIVRENGEVVRKDKFESTYYR